MTAAKKDASEEKPARMSADEILDTLNGFDEIAIAKAFKMTFTEVIEDATLFLRGMAFINERREGKSDAEAYAVAMYTSTLKMAEYFPAPDDELDPDDPDTESGKDASPPA